MSSRGYTALRNLPLVQQRPVSTSDQVYSVTFNFVPGTE
jgi:hypothetical protein